MIERISSPHAWLLALFSAVIVVHATSAVHAEEKVTPQITVKSCDDFAVTGKGDSEAWMTTSWVDLNRRPGGEHDYSARFKMLYSPTGVYVLFDGTDQVLTATMKEDFLDLWNEDVYECFFWTNEEHPVYFEYEISPLGYELPILVPKLDGKYLGWRPWHYEGDRRIQKKVSATDGQNESMAQVSGCARGGLHPLRSSAATESCPTAIGYALASQLLPSRL